jgi:hypothetical protein
MELTSTPWWMTAPICVRVLLAA